MKPKLIYLHIPKCAGSSHRHYLSDALGEDHVFWYGVNSDSLKFDAEEIGPRLAIGGHRNIHHYPENYSALYTSTLRDPLDRAVSYYNYRTTPPVHASDSWRAHQERVIENWRERGMDPDSMLRSIEQCEEFRRDITNAQCAYLSRHGASFSGVQETLKQENMVIGLVEQLDAFNAFFRHDLEVKLQHHVRANTGSPGYATTIINEPGVEELIREINQEDQALYDFVRDEHKGLLVDADNLAEVTRQIVELTGESNFWAPDDGFRWGRVNLFSKGVLKLEDDNMATVLLMIANTGRTALNIADTDRGRCAIKWTVQDVAGNPLDGLQGEVQPNEIVGPGEKLITRIQINLAGLRAVDATPSMLRISLVSDEMDMEQSFPLNSTWTLIHP